jgi:hypothetical protein
MRESRILRQLKDAAERRRETPPQDRFADLVKRGAIDAEGHVLLRIPGLPEDVPETIEDDRAEPPSPARREGLDAHGDGREQHQ